jgi:acetyl-CoA acetyltransferase
VRDVFVAGVGATTFGRSGRSAGALERDALAAAIADAGLTRAQVGAVARAGPPGEGRGRGALPMLGPASASAAQAVQRGWHAVASGELDVVVCVGVQTLRTTHDHAALLTVRARAAEAYMSQSGATAGDLARVVAKNSAQGAENPRAPLARAHDAAEVLDSELLVDPLRRLMVAELSDGAAAVVLAASRRRRGPGPRPLRIRASVLARGRAGEVHGAVAQAGRMAYQAAGLGPDDVDCAEVDDATAAGELMSYEALQFAPEGQGPEMVAGGFTTLGGVLPVNASGGMLAQGEAIRASGVAQICELAWQLRRQAGRRQVAGARVGLACNAGPDDDGTPLVSLTIVSAG